MWDAPWTPGCLSPPSVKQTRVPCAVEPFRGPVRRRRYGPRRRRVGWQRRALRSGPSPVYERRASFVLAKVSACIFSRELVPCLCFSLFRFLVVFTRKTSRGLLRVDLQYFIFLFGSRPLQTWCLSPRASDANAVFPEECPPPGGLPLCVIFFSNPAGLPRVHSELFICVFFLFFLMLFWQRTVCLIRLFKTPARVLLVLVRFLCPLVTFIYLPLFSLDAQCFAAFSWSQKWAARVSYV